MILDFLIHKLTKENPPELNTDKCINSFCKNIECNICREICPEKAIVIKNKALIFDEELCTKCGICKAKCPTQAIRIKEIGEDEIYISAGEKNNLVFGCSLEDSIGNLNISCLNALHPELISALFILYKEKKFHFNLSKCSSCEFGYENNLFKDNLCKAVSFAKSLGIEPTYEIYDAESNLSDLVTEEISRRNLFKLVKKESSNMVVKTINTIIDIEDNQLLIRKALLDAMKNIDVVDERNNLDMFWGYWDVNIDCDGCGKCISNCPGKAWEMEKTDTVIKLYHKFGNCYKCGLCEKTCPKNAITKESVHDFQLSEVNLKREITLNTCNVCNKKFIPASIEDNECGICKKKQLLRRQISSSI